MLRYLFTIISVSDIVLQVLVKLWLKFTSWSIIQKNHARPNVVDCAPYSDFEEYHTGALVQFYEKLVVVFFASKHWTVVGWLLAIAQYLAK